MSTERAKALRRNQTDAERRLWAGLRGRRLGTAKFRRQQPIGPYVADFICFDARLIVEVDGSQHTPEADRARTAFLEAQGYRVLRFWNRDVLLTLDQVLETIEAALRCPLTATPLPRGERGF